MHLKTYDNFLFDFDGVIIDSSAIRIEGFKSIFKEFPNEELEKLLEFHDQNGGLSRYVKIKYFFNEIRKENISERTVNEYAEKFSAIMRVKLVDKAFLIKDSCDFIHKYHQSLNMHIVSGSDEQELKYLCRELGLFNYFKSIQGSPTPKNELVKKLLEENKYVKERCVLIGDAINDYEAAIKNGISFYGYNNDSLRIKGAYIESFPEFKNKVL